MPASSRFRMNSIQKILSLFFIAVLFTAAWSCKNDEEPVNPYDSIDHSTSTTTPNPPDPNSIAGLYKNIFSVKCNNPGCHDGTFEPDFRTVESSYATLVYQSVNKLTLDSTKFYSYRTIPNNVDDSWLIERLTTSTTEYMPSNGIRLSASDIDHVKNWINSGCPDMNGVAAVKPNLPPNITGFAAFDIAGTQIDTNRLNDNPINPFLVTAGTYMSIGFVTTDTADGTSATDPGQFTVKEIHFSTDKDNFSGSTVLVATTYVSAYSAWLAYLPSVNWPVGTTVYFRIYVNDGHHANNTEFPRYDSPDYYKTYFSFYVQ
ncbi:MAG: hypothetical protein IPO49_04570 [Bacteroidetes bacterium]|nr:hypothetical protein [Bacteroidota bacterium]